MGRYVALLVFALFSVSVSAGIYRWVDDEGNVHFSDKAPDTEKSEDLTGQLTPINSDSSARETEKMRDLFKGETPEEAHYRKQQEKAQQARMGKACRDAKARLKKLRGRFYMVDDNGKEIVVSADEQQNMVRDLEQQIRKYCG